MKMGQFHTADERLRRNHLVAKRLDLAIVICMVFVLVTSICLLLILLWNDPRPLWVKIIVFGVGSLTGYSVAMAISSLGGLASGKLAPTWIVDISDPRVVKIKGVVPIMEFQAAESAMLKARPDYTLCDDALRRFGCAMAAVPREQSKQ